MMRLSFLLLLMAADACCAPNSFEGPQSKHLQDFFSDPVGCHSYDDLTKKEFDELLPGHNYKHSRATFRDGYVICSGETPIIAYIARDEKMYSAYTILCGAAGLWYARGPSNKHAFKKSKVCCYGNSTVTLETKACASLGDITHAEFAPLYIPNHRDLEFKKANVTNGKVTCSGDTPIIIHTDKDGKQIPAEKVECKAVWWVSEYFPREDAYTTMKVACYGAVKKMAPQPEKQQDCCTAARRQTQNCGLCP